MNHKWDAHRQVIALTEALQRQDHVAFDALQPTSRADATTLLHQALVLIHVLVRDTRLDGALTELDRLRTDALGVEAQGTA